MIRIGDSEIRSLRLEFDWKNHKILTIVDILRVGCLLAIFILFILLMSSCKDEVNAELPDPVDVTIEYVEPTEIPEEYKDETLLIIKELIQDFIDKGYSLDPDAASRGEVKFIEPNEPKTYTIEELDEIYKDDPALGKLAKRLYGYEEPNEPMKYSLPIPTWPDYIETDRDLHFDKPNTDRQFWLPKGTKIYFKED